MSAGRLIGVLILMQMIGGATANFALEAPLFGSPGFLVNAAPHARQIALGAVLALVVEALWVGIAVTVFATVYERSRTLASWFFALAIVALAVAVVESAAVMSMISVSEAYGKGGAAVREQLETVRVLVASARNWAHYLGRITDGCTILVFYTLLYRLALVPRALAGFGVLAALLMLTGVGMPLFGHEVLFPLLAPLGLVQLLLAGWLMVRGLRA
ncbi:MAG TPA: DUF4386 family protein [Burkholderiales bacterium]|nr:DUF4386 family protein [Burkholderiales bacterium]